MARRSPARFLAPLALVGFVIALFVIVTGARDDGTSGGGGATPAASASPTPGGKKQKARKVRKTYTVKPGDTPSSIAVKTHVPLSQIKQLNPKLDDQTLSVGQKIKLRQ
jgi:LysM repeat protein